MPWNLPMERDLPKSRVKACHGTCPWNGTCPSPVWKKRLPLHYLTAFASSLSHNVYSPSGKCAFTGFRRIYRITLRK